MRVYRDASMLVYEKPDLSKIVVSAESTFYERMGLTGLYIGHKRVGRPAEMFTITAYDSGNPLQSIADFAGTAFPDIDQAITYLNSISA